MSKVKTLSFWISNSEIRHKLFPDQKCYCEAYDYPKITPFEEIDRQLNDCISSIEEYHNVKDIKINDVVVDQHNNGRSDTILRTYTIIY